MFSVPAAQCKCKLCQYAISMQFPTLLGDYTGSSSGVKYFIPTDKPLANTYNEAKAACNRHKARLRNVWDQTLNVQDIKRYYNLQSVAISQTYTNEPGNTGTIGRAFVVCESKLLRILYPAPFYCICVF